MIQHIIEDEMVVADLTDRNANVFYELAIRHAIRRPYVQIMQKGQSIRFDVAGVRTLEVDYRDLDSVADARGRLTAAMQSMQGKAEVDSPISAAVGFSMLRNIDEFNEEVRQMNSILEEISRKIGP